MSSVVKSSKAKNMQLVILAGGKGTRLGLTDIPKPMCPIEGIPQLERQILLAKKYGIEEIFLLEGYLAHVISDYFGNGERFGVKIHHIVEQAPLGTAGALSLIKDKLTNRFMVFYGDVVMDFDIESMQKFDEQEPSVGTLLIHPNNHPYDSDLLEVKDDKIIAFHTKPHDSQKNYHNLVNAAVYILSPEIFEFIENGKQQDFGKDIFPKVLQSGKILRGYKSAEYIKDMGTKDRLPKICEDVAKGRVKRLNKKNPRPAIFLDRDGVLIKDMDKNPVVENFELLEGVEDAIKKINQSGYLAIVVTNQPMIAKGFVTFSDVDDVHKKLETQLGKSGAYLDDIYFCPHHPDKGYEGEIPELKIVCDCRKPKPGMLLKAAQDYHIDLEKSWMIGDRETDIKAGRAAGCRTVFIGENTKEVTADIYAKNLNNATDFILTRKE